MVMQVRRFWWRRAEVMAEVGWTAAEYLAAHHYDETPLEQSARLARQAEDRQAKADARAAVERAARMDDEREARLFRYSQLGIGGRSMADMAEQAARAADEDDRYQEALKTIQRVERRRARDAEVMRSQGEQLAAIARSQTPSDPLEAASARARRALESVVRGDDVLRRARAAQASRPFGGGGSVVRSDVTTCKDCIAVGATAEQSFLIHSDLDAPRVVERPVDPATVSSCEHGFIPRSCSECRYQLRMQADRAESRGYDEIRRVSYR